MPSPYRCRCTLLLLFAVLLSQRFASISALNDPGQSQPSAAGTGLALGGACAGYTAEKLQALMGRALRLREELQKAHDVIGEGDMVMDEIAVPPHTGRDLIRPLRSRPPKCNALPKSRLAPSHLDSFASRPEPLAWRPAKAKYLLANCRKNQASNRRRCYLNHMLLAGMLNRTLVVQYRRSEVVRFYSPRLLLPLSLLRRCYGLHSILTTAEARRRNGGQRLIVQAVICTVGNGTCIHEHGRSLDGFAPLSEDVIFPPSLENTVLGFPKGGHTSLVEMAAKVQRVARRLSVIAVNDMSVQNLALPWGHQVAGDLPFQRRKGCPNALAPPPHPAAFEAASLFMKAAGLEQIGFVGVHWRRGDFLKLSAEAGTLMRISPKQAGECVADKMKVAALTSVFLASNGNASEVAGFNEEVARHIEGAHIVSLPSNWTEEPWAETLWTVHKFSKAYDTEQLGADIDKVVCAMGNLFLGTQFSSFSGLIEHVRVALRRASCSDDLICASLDTSQS